MPNTFFVYKYTRMFLDKYMVNTCNFPSSKELFRLARSIANQQEKGTSEILSDADLGKRIGFESARTSRWKHGQISVQDADRLIALSQALDIDITVLCHVAAGYLTADEALEILSNTSNLVRFLGEQMVLPGDNQIVTLISDNTRFKVTRRTSSHYRRQPKGTGKDSFSELEDIPSILLVDDSPSTIRNFKNLTGEVTGIEGIVSRTGIEGLIAAGKYQPRIVIFDLFIGNLDGFAAIRTISKEKLTSEAEVYASTLSMSPDIVRNALGSGAYDVLQRPLNSKILTTLIQRARIH